ncbi:uncharacterized protein LOC126744087 isoform X1 [Anthonomus grandis grandis]|uniref:uncharacterized protein LOC126744087 isoform X1 n=1 Tax=Anthonomus grandis grandis TaxID=2921223 RepID=UPI002165CD2F|nr:uncharacterized protein LOC126744087 isoform X1 [Anthonomus grandis grandis]
MESSDKLTCLHLLKEKDPSRILRKCLAIIEHQLTQNNWSRQLKTIQQFLFLCQNGLLVKDLPEIVYFTELLLRICVDKKEEFVPVIDELIKILQIPPVLTKTKEVLTFSEEIKEYFDWLGLLIVDLCKNYKLKIIKVVYSLLTTTCSQRKHLSLDTRLDKAHLSNLPDLLGEYIQQVDDEEVYHELLKIIQILINGPKGTCARLLKKSVVCTLIVRLEPKWRERFPLIKPGLPLGSEEITHTERIFQILTKLLEYANNKNMSAPSKFTLWSLQWAFRLFTIKESTKVERNNVLAVLLLLMDIYPDVLVGNLTFAYDIAMLAMNRDIWFHTNWTSDIVLNTSQEDHSCMALLLMCISYFPNCLSGPKVIEECRVVIGLIKLISNQQTIRWQQLQACYLIRLSLNILHKIVPPCPEEFVENGGPLVILELINRSKGRLEVYCFDVVFRSVELLSHLAYNIKSVRECIAYNNGFSIILNLCQEQISVKLIMRKTQLLLSVGICLLEQICSEIDEVLRILPLLISYMKRYVNPVQKEHVQIPNLIIICLSFIWNKVISCEAAGKEFVKMGGVYLMLDIVQVGCMPVKMVALGALIDLCETVQCIPYLITWRKNNQGIKAMLLNVFRQENNDMLVKHDENSIIIDPTLPIMGVVQFFETYCLCKKYVGNAAIADMFISCRPKIYCLLQILDYKQNDTVEIANDCYKLYSEELTVKDQIAYILAENYLALKLCEQWKEIREEFRRLDLEPIPTDEYILNLMADISDKWGKDLQKMQRAILTKYQMKQHKKEQFLYERLRHSNLFDAWESLNQMKFIARCSERLFRVTSNFNLQTQVHQSLKHDNINGEIHRTFPSNLSIACVHNQIIQIPPETYEDSLSVQKPIIVSPFSSGNSSPRLPTDELRGEYLEEDEKRIEKEPGLSVYKSSSLIGAGPSMTILKEFLF